MGVANVAGAAVIVASCVDGGAVSKTVLYEAQNLRLSAGTGITTYARMLSGVARELGYATEVLVAADGPLHNKDEKLSEIALYDAVNALGPRWSHRLMIKAREVVGAPFGIRPVAFRRETVATHSANDQLAGFEVVHAATSIIDVARLHFMRWGQRLKLRPAAQPDLFHTTQATPIEVRGAPNIYTIHDIVPLRVPQSTLEIKPYFLDMIRHLCRNADHIVTVSEFSRTDIMRLTGIGGDRITNTYQAVELPPAYLNRTDAEVADDLERIYGLGFREYFLFVGALEPKKNIERLIEAYASSGTQRPLIIVGKLGWQYDEILAKIADERFYRLVQEGNEFSIRRRVRHLDYVPIGRLVTLLKGARGFLFPSIYEGFGLPVLEAMLAGAPVMTSRSTSLAEVAGDAALLVDPYDSDARAGAIRRLDHDADLRFELSRRGLERAQFFSKQKYAERVQELYRRLL